MNESTEPRQIDIIAWIAMHALIPVSTDANAMRTISERLPEAAYAMAERMQREAKVRQDNP